MREYPANSFRSRWGSRSPGHRVASSVSASGSLRHRTDATPIQAFSFIDRRNPPVEPWLLGLRPAGALGRTSCSNQRLSAGCRARISLRDRHYAMDLLVNVRITWRRKPSSGSHGEVYGRTPRRQLGEQTHGVHDQSRKAPTTLVNRSEASSAGQWAPINVLATPWGVARSEGCPVPGGSEQSSTGPHRGRGSLRRPGFGYSPTSRSRWPYA